MPATPAPAPVPAPVQPQSAASTPPATVDRVEVTEQHASGVETRRQVSASGTTIEDVPVTTSPLPAPVTPSTPAPRVTPQPQPQPRTAPARTGRYVVQVGAFSQEANAKALQRKLAAIGHEATIEHTSLYLVRIGPFDTRDQAASVRAKLEAAGISAIITAH